MKPLAAGFYLLWLVLTLAFLVNHNMGLMNADLNWVLRPLPLVLLAFWVFFQWPAEQKRRLALPVGVLIFAGVGVAVQMPEHFTLAMILSLCGYLAYLTWAAQTVAMGYIRWLLMIPAVLGALLAGNGLWYVTTMIHEALVVYITVVSLFVVAVLLCSRVHWVAIPGAFLLALSEWLTGYNAFIGGVPNADVYALLAWYAGHFLVLHAPLWYQPPLTTPFGYSLDHEEGAPG